MTRHPGKKRTRGFTLIELVITVGLLAVLLAAALPSFFTAIQNNRLTTQANDFMTAVQLARSEALKRNRPVSLCPTNNQTSCSGDWTDGWMVVVDDNAEGDNSVDEDDVLRVWPPTRGDTTINDNLPGGIEFVRYLADGRIDPVSLSGAVLTFQLRIPECRRDSARDIEIVRTGRASVTRVQCT